MRSKKIISFFILFAIVLALMPNALSDEGRSAVLRINSSRIFTVKNGEAQNGEIDSPPVIYNDRTAVPIRAVMEVFDADIVWNSEDGSVRIAYYLDGGRKEITFFVNAHTAYADGELCTLDAPAKIVNDRVMVPLRFIAEHMGFDVCWYGEYEIAVISDTGSAKDVPIPQAWKTTYDDLKVHFIDVGQGDSIYAQLPNGENMLIDAGPSANFTAEYLKNLGCGHIDYVVATHPDSDHITGMPTVLDSFDVREFYMPEKEHTTKTFERMLDSIEANGCRAYYAQAGHKIVDAPDLQISFLAPIKIYRDNNNCSAVVYIRYMENTFLLMGDAEKQEENDIISSGADIDADILKVGHHGSASSTSEELLRLTDPIYAVISCGAGNRYGHPAEETVSKLELHNVQILRTDIDGTIVISGNGCGYRVSKDHL